MNFTISENKAISHEFVEAKWWYIERYECTLVKRDREWWAQTMEKIYQFSKEVEYYKANGVEMLKQKINGNNNHLIYQVLMNVYCNYI